MVGGWWVKSYLRTRIARLVLSMRRLTHLSLVSSHFSLFSLIHSLTHSSSLFFFLAVLLSFLLSILLSFLLSFMLSFFALLLPFALCPSPFSTLFHPFPPFSTLFHPFSPFRTPLLPLALPCSPLLPLACLLPLASPCSPLLPLLPLAPLAPPFYPFLLLSTPFSPFLTLSPPFSPFLTLSPPFSPFFPFSFSFAGQFLKHECESVTCGPSAEMNVVVRCGKIVCNFCTCLPKSQRFGRDSRFMLNKVFWCARCKYWFSSTDGGLSSIAVCSLHGCYGSNLHNVVFLLGRFTCGVF